jgi:hypothetical protein
MDQFSRQIGKSIGFRPTATDFEDIVFSLDVTQLAHAVPECISERRSHVRGRNKKPNPVNFAWLLCLSGQAKRQEQTTKREANKCFLHDLLQSFATLWSLSLDHLIPAFRFWILTRLSNSKASILHRRSVYRASFSAAGSAKSVWMSARAGALAQSLGPTANATVRPSRAMRKVVGKPITP